MTRLPVVLLAYVISSFAAPPNNKVAADLRGVDADPTLDVIVQIKSSHSPEHWHHKIAQYAGT